MQYDISGDDTQSVAISLPPGDTVIAEAGAMMYMENGIEMETRLGDGSVPDQSIWGKLWGAAKRYSMGESVFVTHFTNRSSQVAKVVFAAPYPGKIVPCDLSKRSAFLAQKDAFLCAELGTSLDIAFTRRFGAGLFGGEGFILERIAGNGIALIHAGGNIEKRQLAAGETLRIDTGCIAAFEETVRYDIQMVGGIMNTLFGGEGIVLATLTGPGDVLLQSLPFSRLADRLIAAAGPKRKGEGDALLGSWGRWLDGDNQ